MTHNTEHYKKLLEKELQLLEKDLKTLGRINPDNPKDWQTTPPESVINVAEPEELAEQTEAYENNTAVLKQLEIKYNEVKEALTRIQNNTFGHCLVCNKEIEDDRLEANPAAKTCKEHM
jgi:DnaK suppressor protein